MGLRPTHLSLVGSLQAQLKALRASLDVRGVREKSLADQLDQLFVTFDDAMARAERGEVESEEEDDDEGEAEFLPVLSIASRRSQRGAAVRSMAAVARMQAEENALKRAQYKSALAALAPPDHRLDTEPANVACLAVLRGQLMEFEASAKSALATRGSTWFTAANMEKRTAWQHATLGASTVADVAAQLLALESLMYEPQRVERTEAAYVWRRYRRDVCGLHCYHPWRFVAVQCTERG